MTYIRSTSAGSNDTAQFLYGKASQAVTSVTSSAAAVLENAEKRIRGEVDKTTTLLSSLGKLKSSVADTQGAARVLSGFSTTTTADDMEAGLKKLVEAFNLTVTNSKSVSNTPGGAADAPGASRIGQDLKRAINADATLADTLRTWGVSVGSDGKLVFDDKKFDAQKLSNEERLAVFQKLGQVIDKVATRELTDNGKVARSMTSLTERADLLKTQQSTLLDALQIDTSTDDEEKSKEEVNETKTSTEPATQKSWFDLLQKDISAAEPSAAARNALTTYMTVKENGQT